MLGTCFPPSRHSAPAPSTMKTGGALNGRTLTAAPPAFPRITCHSRWWSALAQGGFKGWYRWLVRTHQDERLSVAERLNKPEQAADAIRAALKRAASNQKISADEFKKIIKEAHWYGVDVGTKIRSTLSTMPQDQLEKIKTACDKQESVGWLVQVIDEKISDIKNLGARLKDGVYTSAMLSIDGFSLNGPTQKQFWLEMDRGFDGIGTCHIEKNAAAAFEKDGIWKLLPFAELGLNKAALSSRVLEQVCRQALNKIAGSRTIDLGKLNDVELYRFHELTQHGELKAHARACEKEIGIRLRTAKCKNLAAHLEKRVSDIRNSANSTKKADQPSLEQDLFEGLSDRDISTVALGVISKLSLPVVLQLSTLESNGLSDMWLNEIAKAQLKTPAVALMDDLALIDYLKSPGNEGLSKNARNKLVDEAGRRAEIAYQAGYGRLRAGLESDSCNRLVRSVFEFSERLACGAELQRAAGLEDTSKDLPPGFSAMLLRVKQKQIMRARHLAIDLIAEGNQKSVGDQLSRAIGKLRSGMPLVPMNLQDKQFMERALSQHISNTAPVPSQPSAMPNGIELGEKFLDLFNADMIVDYNFRKARTAAGEELPVCEQFIQDQRSVDMQIDGSPIFNAHIADHTGRAQIFVNKMRTVKGVSEEQIMTASRIASQNTGAALVKLVRNEKLFSLTSEEAAKAGVEDVGLGLAPAGLDRLENFVCNKNGSLTVHLRLFNENVENWSGTSCGPVKIDPITVMTDPEVSSFSVELRFEIDRGGKIQEVIFENSAMERNIVPINS
jgi:hypothetical protein